MKKNRRILAVVSAFLMLSMSLAPTGFAQQESPTPLSEEVFTTGNNPDSDPINYSRFRTTNENETPIIERSSTATVYDENGNIVDVHNIEKNTLGSEEKSFSTLASSGRLCRILVVVDEEYRAAHSDWMTKTANIVEGADDAFNRDFGIDFTVTEYRYWTSSGSNAYQILDNLIANYSSNSYDFVIGFTAEKNFKDEFTIQLSGTAQKNITSNPVYGTYAVNWDQNNYYSDWHSLQHEISHLYSLEHDFNGPSPICIMNYGTMYNTSSWDSAHFNQLAVRVGWYGTPIN